MAGGGAPASSSLRSGRLNTKLSSLTSFASPCGPAKTTRNAPSLLLPPRAPAPGASAPFADLTGLFAPSMHAAPTTMSPTNSRDQRKNRELASFAGRFMGIAAQSATGVPRPQSRIWAGIRGRMWPAGRTLRGSRHTAQLTLAALVFSSLAALCAPAQAQVSSASSEGWSRRLASSHYQRATELEQRGDIAQALREYSETIAIDSTLGDAYLRLGALRERMGDTREAELIYSEAIRLGDSRAQALVQRSHLHRAAGRSKQALSDLEAAVELEPESRGAARARAALRGSARLGRRSGDLSSHRQQRAGQRRVSRRRKRTPRSPRAARAGRRNRPQRRTRQKARLGRPLFGSHRPPLSDSAPHVVRTRSHSRSSDADSRRELFAATATVCAVRCVAGLRPPPLEQRSRRAEAGAVIVGDQNAVRLSGAIGTAVQKHAIVDREQA